MGRPLGRLAMAAYITAHRDLIPVSGGNSNAAGFANSLWPLFPPKWPAFPTLSPTARRSQSGPTLIYASSDSLGSCPLQHGAGRSSFRALFCSRPRGRPRGRRQRQNLPPAPGGTPGNPKPRSAAGGFIQAPGGRAAPKLERVELPTGWVLQ